MSENWNGQWNTGDVITADKLNMYTTAIENLFDMTNNGTSGSNELQIGEIDLDDCSFESVKQLVEEGFKIVTIKKGSSFIGCYILSAVFNLGNEYDSYDFIELSSISSGSSYSYSFGRNEYHLYELFLKDGNFKSITKYSYSGEQISTDSEALYRHLRICTVTNGYLTCEEGRKVMYADLKQALLNGLSRGGSGRLPILITSDNNDYLVYNLSRMFIENNKPKVTFYNSETSQHVEFIANGGEYSNLIIVNK